MDVVFQHGTPAKATAPTNHFSNRHQGAFSMYIKWNCTVYFLDNLYWLIRSINDLKHISVKTITDQLKFPHDVLGNILVVCLNLSIFLNVSYLTSRTIGRKMNSTCLLFEFHFTGQDTSKIQSFSSCGSVLVLHARFISSKTFLPWKSEEKKRVQWWSKQVIFITVAYHNYLENTIRVKRFTEQFIKIRWF